MQTQYKKRKNNRLFLNIFILVTAIIIMYRLVMGDINVFTKIGEFFKIIKPILFAILVAYLLYIPVKKLENLFEKTNIKFFQNHRKSISITIVYLTIAIILYFVIKLAVPLIYNNTIELIKSAPGIIEELKKYVMSLPADNWISTLHLEQQIEKLQKLNLSQQLLNKLTMEEFFSQVHKLMDIGTSIFNIFVTFVVSIYMLYYRSDIRKFLYKLIESFTTEKTTRKIQIYVKKINMIFYRYITTQLLDGIIVGIIMSIALIIMKVKYAIALGFLIGLFNLIPYFGAIFAVLLATLVSYFTGGVSQAILVVLITTILQQIDANIINPILLGTSLDINKILIIVSITVGGAYFGALGMFLAVPIITIITIIINDYLDAKIRKKKIARLIKNTKTLKLKRLKTETNK